MSRWKQIKVASNEGTNVPAWTKGGYITYLNINHGKTPPSARGQVDRHGHYWWFGVYLFDEYGVEGEYVGEGCSLAKAKEVADDHRKTLTDASDSVG
jgi:hypothetical protein